MATIYLVRHGQASFGTDDYDRLSALGQRQADATGEYFSRLGVQFDRVYSGDLARQRETCERVVASQAGSVEHVIDARFNEIQNDQQIEKLSPLVTATNPLIKSLMEKGLSSSKDYQKVIEAVFKYWVSHDCSAFGIQSWPEYSGLVRCAVQDVMAREGSGKTIGIFASGGTIATAVAQVLGLDGEHTYKFYEPIFNCSVTQLFYSGEHISLSYFNDRSFLQVMGLETGESLISYR